MTLQFRTENFPNESTRAPQTATDEAFETFWRDAVGGLPRETASDAFTDQVMRRVEIHRGTPRWRPLIAATVLLATGLGTYSYADWRQRLEATDRLAELRAEYEVLRDEMAALEEARRKKGLVYLGGESDVELVLDVGRLARRQRAAKTDSKS